LQGSGQQLDSRTREFFEARLGHDFSRVRIHTGTTESASARAINARAYTVGQDIVMGRGEYRASSTAGRYLLAHELTHVMQQEGSGRSAHLHRYSYGTGTPPDTDWRVMSAEEQKKTEVGMKKVSDVVQNEKNKNHKPCKDRFEEITPPPKSGQELIDRYNSSVLWATTEHEVFGQSLPPNDVALHPDTIKFAGTLYIAGTVIHEFGHNSGFHNEPGLERTVSICGFPPTGH
jgi:hypothetical protein